jgi:hypothetical protein
MRVQVLSFIAKLMGVRFKVDGLPYGARPKNITPGDCSSASH